MRWRIFRYLLPALPLFGALLAAPAGAEGRAIDSYCREDGDALEGWYINNSHRGDSTSYLILQKKQQPENRFYLCRLDGEERFFIRELAIDMDPATARVEAARCTPVDTGVPGSEYFSVIDNRSARLLRVYRFDALEEDIEAMPAQRVVCSSLPAG